MAWLLDTSFCVALLREKPLARRWFARHDLAAMAVSVVTEMELQIGVLQAGQPAGEQQKVDALLRHVRVLPWDSTAARVTAAKYDLLAGQGSVLEAADTFLAGHALALDFILVTADKHLLSRAAILGLRVEDYRAVSP